ncbi:phosphoadenosine phosphosulfate reductase domain-containing protein [Litoreibacter albidus]|uniref:phosphoadenosine phosphosulfate reductase domain-containing protein n=1 Tax=Litoreibacter albidus TaxID=670155 RepID=UPI0037357970
MGRATVSEYFRRADVAGLVWPLLDDLSDVDLEQRLFPLANWVAHDTKAYISKHGLPPHPLVAKGYASLGCAPCTGPAEGREGRWKGQTKTECGIHFEGGRAANTGVGT